MKTCPDAPLSASADTISLPSPSKVNRLRRFCASMAIPFSPCCAGCTGCEFAHLVVSSGFAAYFFSYNNFPVSAWSMVAYVLLVLLQLEHKTYSKQFAQCILCIAATCASASCSNCAVLHWFIMVASILHLGTGLALVELHRIGDCRQCMNEAHKCQCGRSKDPVPPGALMTLVECIEHNWVPVSQRENL